MRCRIESVGASLSFSGTKDDDDSLKLAVDAARTCLDSSCHPLYEIGYLINTGVYHNKDISTPAFAAFIQNQLGMNTDFKGKSTLSFDILNGASGMLIGIKMVISAIKSGAIRMGMVVSSASEPVTGSNNFSRYRTSGSALIIDISPAEQKGFGSFVFRTFDEYSDLYCGFADPYASGCKAYILKSDNLEEVYLQCASKVFEQILETEGILREDVDLVFASQISSVFLHRLAGCLRISQEKVVDISRILLGDSLTTSPFIALDYAVKNSMVTPDMKIIFLSMGSGITVGSAVYYS
jgi:3-oxoacyl-[acyl-carrier-protein] synthase III